MSTSDGRQAHKILSLRGAVGPDDICAHYAVTGVSLKLRLLKLRAAEEGVPDILIEGEKQAFVFLADLLLALTEADDCGCQLSATGPGNRLFDPGSEFGLYLHVLPCSNNTAEGK